MDRFLRTLSIRRKKRPKIPESNGGSHPISWQEDERKVREGTCSFQVKYLGSIEVFESRGIQICEDAIKRLKSQSKHKRQRAILYVSGDALRVVDELSKGLLVDQTIEKVSFCAPDRYHSKGFAYICRDGTTRRWLCHGFLAVKESGERLSHAVGCAFAICLEKKQKREREAVTVQFNEDRTSFTRFGSFRQVSLAERLQDPQAVKPVPSSSTGETSAANTTTTSTEATATSDITATVNTSASTAANGSEKLLPPTAIQRPHASADLLERQASFRGFPKLHELVSPFKRHVSLRLTELPSTRERRAHDFDVSSDAAAHNGSSTDSASAKSHTSHSSHKRDDASIGLSNSAFAAAPQPAPSAAPPLPQTVPNGVNPNASLWQTPTIVEEEEPALEPAVAPTDDPFAAAPFSSKPHVTQTSNVAATMHHSLTSGSIASAATPTASASPSVASGLSTPARPLGGFSLLTSSTSMTPVASPQPPVGVPLSIQPTLGGVASVSGSVMMTPIGGGMYAASNVVVMPSGNVVVAAPFGMVGPVNPATMASGGTLVMAPGNTVMPLTLPSQTPMTPPPQTTLTAAQFAESSVPPSANRAQFAASGGPTSPTTGSNVDPFDVAWAEKQTTRARLNNPFANTNFQAQTSNADSSSNANRPVVETFNVRL